MYGPTLPATGGGWIPFAGLIFGVSMGSWIIVAVSLLLITLVVVSFWDLRRGEKRIAKLS